MRKLLNTLYVTKPDTYLALDNENVVVLQGEEKILRLPLLNLESIITFGYTGASPALMAACAKNNITLTFMTESGRFLARVIGEVHGNVVLRKEQYRLSDSQADSLELAKVCITGKLYNSRWVLERAIRDHGMRLDVDRLKRSSALIQQALEKVDQVQTLEDLRGLEGEAARYYFREFDQLILQQKDTFFYRERSRRPPLDAMNALLSFVYTLLANDVAAGLEAVGLDPYVGFLHRDRPGRVALALDLMEELRPVLADRFALALINRKEISAKGFAKQESGAVVMDEDTRKTVLSSWQEKKKEELTHPFLEEKISWGLVGYAQALLLARHLRGDMDAYPAFFWK